MSIERALGWSRQLRLTPSSPLAYAVTRMLTAMVLGLGSVVVVYAAGLISQKPTMPSAWPRRVRRVPQPAADEARNRTLPTLRLRPSQAASAGGDVTLSESAGIASLGRSRMMWESGMRRSHLLAAVAS